MNELFLRTVSQGLQAFMPVAVGFSWLRRHGCATARASLVWGIVVAIAATPVAGYWFKYTVHQARWEAVLAEAAAASPSVSCRRAVELCGALAARARTGGSGLRGASRSPAPLSSS